MCDDVWDAWEDILETADDTIDVHSDDEHTDTPTQVKWTLQNRQVNVMCDQKNALFCLTLIVWPI